jgi:hypothetical protein
MAIFLIVFIIADIVIVAISYSQYRVPVAHDFCQFLAPLCGYPRSLVVVAVLLIGIRFAMRA